MNTSKSIGTLLIAGASIWLGGCGMSNPRLAYIKSPEASPCKAADCPTLELPAPNDNDMFNPIDNFKFDGSGADKPVVFASKGRVWFVMVINPGKHKVGSVAVTGTNLIGAIGGAAKDDLEFEAKSGTRYFLFARAGVGGYSSKPWIEESTGERTVVAGERKLEAHSMAASLLGGEDAAAKSMVEVWWAGVPTYDKQFKASAERVGAVPAEVLAKPAGAPADAAKPAADKPVAEADKPAPAK